MCHTSAISCEAHAARDKADRDFEELMKKNGWQRCPQCRASCERQSGCNFMTCASSACRGRTHFCYLCGDKLTQGQHFTHFPQGVYEHICEKVDRREDEALPEARYFI
mmetsp:Transcript_133001/g.296623  ORF Transcript_133001/g.296623 Transcript_133001/m.296623 type:complete len:108 (+) Transcript_133001:3-326(+)